jgi:NADPH:quinone reductase-like Zn-dependent oxidoreductase
VRVLDVPAPEPRADQALVRVRAAAVTSGDARIRGARFPGGFGVPARLALGVRRPRRRILGNSFSGEVEAVGGEVRDVAPGDLVCGMTGAAMGTHAELLVVPARRAVRVPAGVGHGAAAGVLFGGTTAWHFLRKAGVGPGTTVLVNGASGAVGTNAVQLARHLGATVTGVTSGTNADLVRRLGAEEVVDHTERDVAALDERFDVVLDAVGNLDIPAGRRLLRPGGRLVLAVATLGQLLRARGDVIAGSAPERAEDVQALLGLVASGELEVVVEHELGLDDIVAAHARVDSGHKVGNVLVHP